MAVGARKMGAAKVLSILCLLMVLLSVVMSASATKKKHRRKGMTPWHRNFTRPDSNVGDRVSNWKPGHGNPEELGSYFQGDIMLPAKPPAVTRNGVDYGQFQWENATVPFELASTLEDPQLKSIKTAMSNIESTTCVRFIPHTNEKDYVYIQNEDTGCWSSVGRAGGKQILNLQTYGCSLVGTTMHEMMHALGFFHEHTRDDRDKWVDIQWKNVMKGMEGNFDIWPFRKSTYGVPYDYGSILHYTATAFSTDESPTIITKVPDMKIGQRIALTSGDIKRINSMYKCQVPEEKPLLN